MSNSRPRSWYAVPQPYTNQSPGQQAPLPPGAPDFPPVSAAPATVTTPTQARYQSAGHAPHRSVQQQYDLQHQDGQSRYASLPLATSQNGGPPAHAAAMGYHWSPGHQSRHSQPVLPSQTDEAAVMLSSPYVEPPTRSKSPKLGSHHEHHVPAQPRQNSAGPLHDPSEISRIRTPQPRRNTVPSPILPPTPVPIPTTNANVRAPTPSGRRPLPAPPQQPVPQLPSATFDFHRSASSSMSPSPDLSRSPSIASNASVSSSDSTRRRPLPRPPQNMSAEQPEKRTSSTNPPASYADAQAFVSRNTFPSHQYPGGPRSIYNPPQEEPAHVQNVRSRVEQMTIQARQAADARSSMPSGIPSISHSSSTSSPSIHLPVASVPSFSFDEPDEPSSSAAPAISISVAPPSPSLKATSSEYFGVQLEDEHVPLPSSSVPMATSTKAHATACPKCERPVLYGRTVNAMGQRWHPDCFVCEQCDTKLEHMEFFTKDGRPYCHVDYHEVSASVTRDRWC